MKFLLHRKHKCYLVFMLLALSQLSIAHQLSTAYLNLYQTQAGQSTGRFQISLQDLSIHVDLDRDHDAEVSWGEIKQLTPQLLSWLQNHLNIQDASSSCQAIQFQQMLIDQHFNENYLVMDFTLSCADHSSLEVVYDGLFKVNPNHKLIVNYQATETTISRIMSAQQTQIFLRSEQVQPWQSFKEYTYQGVVHILIGLDHIMFLICLLFSAVLKRSASGQYMAVKHTFKHVLLLVTAFTLAHSVTLVLTAVNWISLPSRWVEVVIALTVGLTALHNLYSFIKRLVLVTFVFGLFHGMGFAGVLGELGLPPEAQMLPILAFNIGVELGQIMLIFLILPMLLLLRRHLSWADVVFKASSLVIFLLAIYWVVQRY